MLNKAEALKGKQDKPTEDRRRVSWKLLQKKTRIKQNE